MGRRDPGESQTEALIDRALREEPRRPVTQGFARRLKQRLTLVALMDREHRRFRHSLAAAGFFSGGGMAVFGVVCVAADVPGFLRRTIPGLLGYCDYLAASIATFGGFALAMGALAAGFSFGVAALITLRPGYKETGRP